MIRAGSGPITPAISTAANRQSNQAALCHTPWMFAPPEPACFLIADISGYTKYLGGVELDHAQDILADLIGSIVSALGPNFKLAKLEGDAAFTYSSGEMVDGSMLLDTIESCYFGFRRRRRDVAQATSCECDACVKIPDLDLKFVVHHGEAIFQQVAGHSELLGPDVIVAHRLLKNHVVDELAVGAYALISQQCIDVSGLAPAELLMTSHTEEFESVGEVAGWVHDLDRRWDEEEERTRVIVTPDESVLTVTTPTSVSPQTAWEFLTKPQQRMSWQPWVTEVEIKDATGGRRGLGTANHCMHGPNAVIEEILDWRPYDYVTDRTIVETPHGLVDFKHTIEFEPTAAGTVIEYRFSLPEDPALHEVGEYVAEHYGDALRSAIPALVEQLEAEYGAQTSD